MSVCAHDPYCPGHGPHHDEAVMLEKVRAHTAPKAKTENPLTGEPMLADNAAYVTQVREVRRGAKKALRSGNPAKRGPAARALAHVPGLLAAAYRKDASEQAVGVTQ